MNRQLFREEALARRGRAEPLDGLLRVTAPHMWVVLAGLAVMLAVALAWALFGSVDDTVDADCALILPGERYAVLSETAGTVEETLVNVGDTVRAGQPLARMRTPSLDLELRIARSVLDALETEVEASNGLAAAARADVQRLTAASAAGQVVSSSVTGEIAALGLVPGQAIEVGSQIALVRFGDGSRPEAVAFVQQKAAQLIQAGQRATVVRMGANGDALGAVVASIADQPAMADAWLTDVGLASPPRSHFIRLSLTDLPTVKPADGEQCRIRIVVGSHAPIGFLGTAGPNGHGAQ